jgi:hypothetical protein
LVELIEAADERAYLNGAMTIPSAPAGQTGFLFVSQSSHNA